MGSSEEKIKSLQAEVSRLKEEVGRLEKIINMTDGIFDPLISSQTGKQSDEKEIIEKFTIIPDLKKASRLLINEVVHSIPNAQSGTVMIYVKARNSMQIIACCGLDLMAGETFEIEVSPEKMYGYDAFIKKELQVLNQDETIEYFGKHMRALHRNQTVVQQMIQPLIYNNETLGFLTVSHYRADYSFSKRSIQFLENMASGLTAYLERFSLYIDSTMKNRRIMKLGKSELSTEEIYFLKALDRLERKMNRILFIRCGSPYVTIYFNDDSVNGRPSISPLDERINLVERISVSALESHFDEDDLLRVHRSLMVNPKMVIQAHETTRANYELELKGPFPSVNGWPHQRIKLGRSYVPQIRKKFPEWFRKNF